MAAAVLCCMRCLLPTPLHQTWSITLSPKQIYKTTKADSNHMLWLTQKKGSCRSTPDPDQIYAVRWLGGPESWDYDPGSAVWDSSRGKPRWGHEISCSLPPGHGEVLLWGAMGQGSVEERAGTWRAVFTVESRIGARQMVAFESQPWCWEERNEATTSLCWAALELKTITAAKQNQLSWTDANPAADTGSNQVRLHPCKLRVTPERAVSTPRVCAGALPEWPELQPVGQCLPRGGRARKTAPCLHGKAFSPLAKCQMHLSLEALPIQLHSKAAERRLTSPRGDLPVQLAR